MIFSPIEAYKLVNTIDHLWLNTSIKNIVLGHDEWILLL